MKMFACSVLDKAVGAYSAPQFFRSTGEAVRSFMDAVASNETPFHRHAEDYVFMCVGEWDDNAGILSGREPQRLISAVECVNPVPAGDGSQAKVVQGKVAL